MGIKIGDISTLGGAITGKGIFGKGLAKVNKVLGPVAGVYPRMAASAQNKAAARLTKAEMANAAGSMSTAPAARNPLNPTRAAKPSAPPIMTGQSAPLTMGKQLSQGVTTGYGSFRNAPSGSAETMIKKPRESILGGGSDAMSNRENTKDF